MPFETSHPDKYFAASWRPVKLRGCDCPGCGDPGDYRAPKSREQLTDYYWFCLAHVREYNRQWDYFAGMDANAIEDQIRKATVWERPTWPIGGSHPREQDIRDQVFREFFGGDKPPEPPPVSITKTERDALLMLELAPPVGFAAIKAQYRIMVKRHHPDANGGSFESEEKFKNINQAFTLLKQLHGVEEA